MRPAAPCTTPPFVHCASGTPPGGGGGGGPPPPTVTWKATAGVVVTLPAPLVASFATIDQLQSPSVSPERFTLHKSLAPLPAENDCAMPPFGWTRTVTDLTPLASATVA